MSSSGQKQHFDLQAAIDRNLALHAQGEAVRQWVRELDAAQLRQQPVRLQVIQGGKKDSYNGR